MRFRSRDHLWWYTGALFLPLLLVLLLLWRTGRYERARRLTETRVLADYGAIAAAELRKETERVLHTDHITPAFHAVAHQQGDERPAADERRPRDPSALLGGPHSTSLVSRYARSAFRLDLSPTPRLSVAGAPYDSATRAVIVRRLLAELADETTREPHRAVVDTLAGTARFLWLWIDQHQPGAATERPRAVYGVESSDSVLHAVFSDILERHKLLPSALLLPPYRADGLAVSVEAPSGRRLWSNGTVSSLGSPGFDTLPPFLGGARISASAGPRLAALLNIGRPSPLYLPVLIALLILSLVLGLVAVAQLRRSREIAALRQQFIANVSHELRTPLTHMSMFTEMLADARVRDDGERKHYAQVVQRETKRLTTLVESVLRFSKSQNGVVRLNPERRDLAREVHDAVDFFRPLAAARDVTVDVVAAPGAVANVDPGALRQVLLNLLDNAVKYGPNGQHVGITLAASAAIATITVSDQGRGIERHDHHRVFDAYVRVHREGHAVVAGTGIGLAVVHELVRAHGGRVWIDSPVAGGTAVSFTTPLAGDA